MPDPDSLLEWLLQCLHIWRQFMWLHEWLILRLHQWLFWRLHKWWLLQLHSAKAAYFIPMKSSHLPSYNSPEVKRKQQVEAQVFIQVRVLVPVLVQGHASLLELVQELVWMLVRDIAWQMLYGCTCIGYCFGACIGACTITDNSSRTCIRTCSKTCSFDVYFRVLAFGVDCVLLQC